MFSDDVKYSAIMDATSTAEEVSSVRRLLAELELSIQLRANAIHRGAIETLPWTLTVAVPTTTFLTAFAKKAGERSGDAAADAVEEAVKVMHGWLVRLRESRHGSQGVLILTDKDRGLDVVMPSGISLEACGQLKQALETLPTRVVPPGELRWTGRRWVHRPL